MTHAPPTATDRSWGLEDAVRWLLGLELFGMSFGLERMWRLMTALGSPQRSFRSVHVVGSNGKSSTARMIAAILERHGHRTGTYLSPHFVSFTERVRVGERDIGGGDFAEAARLACRAAAAVDRTLAAGERVTQFEAVTATGYLALQRAAVDVAVVEAGLGGRFDATNVLDSEVQVLTGVGLEHTRWLGPTITDIAGEKADVVRPGATLVVGEDLAPDALLVARRVCDERGARLVTARPGPGAGAALQAPFQRRNFAIARAASQALIGDLDEAAVADAAANTTVPGRFEVVSQEPVTVFDGAHNPDGISALVDALGGFVGERSLVCCMSVLDDKDAAAMLREMAPLCDEFVFTSGANPRTLPPATLESLCRQLGGPPARVVADPREALAVTRKLAGSGGVALATGSLYLIADLVRPPGAERGSIL